MPWDPEKYNQFKDIRYQPFFDLAALISTRGLQKAVDLGCGTGEQTDLLARSFDKADFLGVDPSAEMLSESSAFRRANLEFRTMTVEDFILFSKNERWDLIFSNAALQWSDNHPVLFARLLSLLSDTGQFAVQMPVQNENLLNQLLIELAQEKPFVDFLQGWKRESPLLSIDGYAQLMFDSGLTNIQIMQKVYPIIAEGPEPLFNFISGSALIPYLDRMSATEQLQFVTVYKKRIARSFGRFPAIYAFKRLLLYGTKNKADATAAGSRNM